MSEAIALTTHLFFARDGSTIDSTTVGRSAKPDVDPEANWTDLGQVAGFTTEDNSETEDIWAGQPGAVSLYDELKVKDDRTYNFEMIQANPVALEAIYGADGAISSNYVPGGKSTKMKGWIKVQQYNQDDELVNAFDVYCSIMASGVTGPTGGRFAYSLACRQLYSSLNTGNMTNLS